MSAYLCENEHFTQLAGWLCNDDQSGLNWIARQTGYIADYIHADDLATHIANILKKENSRSLGARYDDRADEYWSDKDDTIPPITLGEVMRMESVSLGKIAKSVACYEYQACESRDYEESKAAKICQMIRKEICTRSPGYEEANWGAPVEFTEPAPEIISLFKLATQQ